MKSTSWAWQLHVRVAGAIRDARRLRQITVKQLAEKTTQLGYPISYDVIVNYENCRKQSLDVAELLVLAHVLNIPALSLLFPDPPDSPVEVVPGVTVSTLAAIMKFAGDTAEHGPRIQLQQAVFELERVIGSVMTGQGILSGVPQQQS